jgi:hypothetical protein
MQLTYRGISYTPQSSLEVNDTDLTHPSNSSTFQLDTYRVTIPQSVATLHYRGVAYLRGR